MEGFALEITVTVHLIDAPLSLRQDLASWRACLASCSLASPIT